MKITKTLLLSATIKKTQQQIYFSALVYFFALVYFLVFLLSVIHFISLS
jgi:hypothetical protein